MHPRIVLVVTIGLLALLAGMTTFLFVRANTSSESVQAEPERSLATEPAGAGASQSPPAPAASPTPVPTAEGLPGLPAEPVEFQPGWAEPYYDADRARPRVEQVINGIRIGPDVRGDSHVGCAPGSSYWADPESARGTPVWIEPSYLPDDALGDGEPRLRDMEAVACEETAISLRVMYGRAAAPDVMERLAGGESWFDIPTGGYVTIFRSISRGPNVTSSEASDRWYGTTIDGLPAAVAKPILERGLGEAWAVTWNPDTEVVTIIRGLNMTADEVIRIAEGLQ